MNQYQPLYDTFKALAGGSVHRAARPGEQFEQPQQCPPARRKDSLMRQLYLGVWLKLKH